MFTRADAKSSTPTHDTRFLSTLPPPHLGLGCISRAPIAAQAIAFCYCYMCSFYIPLRPLSLSFSSAFGFARFHMPRQLLDESLARYEEGVRAGVHLHLSCMRDVGGEVGRGVWIGLDWIGLGCDGFWCIGCPHTEYRTVSVAPCSISCCCSISRCSISPIPLHSNTLDLV